MAAKIDGKQLGLVCSSLRTNHQSFMAETHATQILAATYGTNGKLTGTNR